jgi:hypothetical protein
MASGALTAWQTGRSQRLDRLLTAHRAVGGTDRGRRTETEEINWALVLLLAAEFQGFARDLHDEAVDIFASQAAGARPQVLEVLRNQLTEGRKLDQGNANAGALGSDFGRIGLRLVPALKVAHHASMSRLRRLAALNEARNAIAHANSGALTHLRHDGHPMTLVTVRSWRGALDGLTQSMDAVVSAYLTDLFSITAPW